MKQSPLLQASRTETAQLGSQNNKGYDLLGDHETNMTHTHAHTNTNEMCCDSGGCGPSLSSPARPLWLAACTLKETRHPHTMESLISEPSRTLGRGQVGEYSTWLCLASRGRRSEASEKLLAVSGEEEESWVGVLQM